METFWLCSCQSLGRIGWFGQTGIEASINYPNQTRLRNHFGYASFAYLINANGPVIRKVWRGAEAVIYDDWSKFLA